MKRHVLSRAACAVCVLAILFAPGLPSVSVAAAQDDVSGEFILRAPADRIGAIAQRHGLTIVRAVEGHSNVFLVRANGTPPLRRLRSMRDRWLRRGYGAQPETTSSAELQQLTANISVDPD